MACKQESYQANREKILARKAEYYQENIEAKKLYNQQYRQQNSERLKEKDRQYRLNNLEKARERELDYNRRNRQKRRNYMREYYKRKRLERSNYNKQYRQENSQRLIEYGRAKYLQNREAILAQKREDRKLNPEKYRQRGQKNYQKHREQKLARNKIWRTSPRGRLIRRQLEQKREAIKKLNHQVSYTPEQQQSILEAFSNCCAYCASPEVLTLDHFIAIANGGSETLGNLLPACRSCNSSKQNKDPKEWFRHQPFHSAKRWRQILKVLGKTEKNYNQIPLL
uniref:HNH endonuclease n=1 Tax=Trichocoleus desertorum TaxID=1481672 RepID=UPI0025B59AB8|nr:HNH endonuclease signature motif containing protein [Trichocoleus desertorum]